MEQSRRHSLSSDETSIILDSIADGVFTVDMDFLVTSFNRAAEEITGVPRGEALGRPCREVFRADICETDCALKRTMETGKPFIDRPVTILRTDGRRVPISISTALLRDRNGTIIGGVETFRDLSVVEELRKQVEARYTFADILSRSHRMMEIFAILPEVAESDSTVLIEGESGTGKELLARAIHHLSPRGRKPMVVVNCGALPDTLLESELFGYKAGAFTDARKDKPGRFARAEGGTIFLDEIGDISPALQVRLLRVLQERVYEPLGSTEPVRADVRVVAATNKDLDEEVRAGRFRQDLYFRINVIRISLPPLRERKEDIPLLVEHFIDRMNRLRGRRITGLSHEALGVFMRYDWPGNVRELENAIEHAFVLCHGGEIELHHLPRALREIGTESEAMPRGKTLAEIEARAIYDALARHDWKRLAAARELGIDKTTLWRKMKRLKFDIPGQQR
ncbi:MAG: sigma 54-interacting transcriptional regulator [Deltaproteobacteria bacterium]|nr:sigma 54-interacting transcriptional regulator [Deltaproteobacteria bacterium]